MSSAVSGWMESACETRAMSVSVASWMSSHHVLSVVSDRVFWDVWKMWSAPPFGKSPSQVGDVMVSWGCEEKKLKRREDCSVLADSLFCSMITVCVGCGGSFDRQQSIECHQRVIEGRSLDWNSSAEQATRTA